MGSINNLPPLTRANQYKIQEEQKNLPLILSKALTKVPLARIVLGQPPQHVRTSVGEPRSARRDQPEMFRSEKNKFVKIFKCS